MKQCSQSIGFNLQRLVRGQGPAGSPQPQVKDAAARGAWAICKCALFPTADLCKPPPFSLRHQWGSPDNLIDKVGLASSVKSPARSDKKGRWAAEKWSVKSGLPQLLPPVSITFFPLPFLMSSFNLKLYFLFYSSQLCELGVLGTFGQPWVAGS